MRVFFTCGIVLLVLVACGQRFSGEGIQAGENRFVVDYKVRAVEVDSQLIDEYAKPIAVKEARNEWSGLAHSVMNKGGLWTHEDSGSDAICYLLGVEGAVKARVKLTDKDVKAIDYEDIAVGPGPKPGISYLYLADTGDNNERRRVKQIYRFAEPESKRLIDGKAKIESGVSRLEFTLKNGLIRDFEAMFVDPLTRDIYLFSKQIGFSEVYRFSYPQSKKEVTKIALMGILPFNRVVGADISADGRKVLVKTLREVFYWERPATQSLSDLFSSIPVRVPYKIEPQGEAICFDPSGAFFYTLSESIHGSSVFLYRYHFK